jgi:hypothetical protein
LKQPTQLKNQLIFFFKVLYSKSGKFPYLNIATATAVFLKYLAHGVLALQNLIVPVPNCNAKWTPFFPPATHVEQEHIAEGGGGHRDEYRNTEK